MGVTLYFGLSRLERLSVTEEEWVEFLETVSPRYSRMVSPSSMGLVNISTPGGRLSSQFGPRHSLPRHPRPTPTTLTGIRSEYEHGFKQISVG